jgi:hypothetical protein
MSYCNSSPFIPGTPELPPSAGPGGPSIKVPEGFPAGNIKPERAHTCFACVLVQFTPCHGVPHCVNCTNSPQTVHNTHDPCHIVTYSGVAPDIWLSRHCPPAHDAKQCIKGQVSEALLTRPLFPLLSNRIDHGHHTMSTTSTDDIPLGKIEVSNDTATSMEVTSRYQSCSR